MTRHPHRLRLRLPSRTKHEQPPPLGEVAPAFSDELRELLLEAGHPELAGQLATLPLVERCPCRDLACASFYTVPRLRALARFGRGGHTIHLSPKRGTLSVDVVNGQIVAVEVLERSDVWAALTPPHQPARTAP